MDTGGRMLPRGVLMQTRQYRLHLRGSRFPGSATISNLTRTGGTVPPKRPGTALAHMPAFSQRPQADGLYDPRYEHDACGVALVARLDNEATHDVVDRALTALDNLEHRGAEGADVKTGDGAGILLQLPDEFFRA